MKPRSLRQDRSRDRRDRDRRSRDRRMILASLTVLQYHSPGTRLLLGAGLGVARTKKCEPHSYPKALPEPEQLGGDFGVGVGPLLFFSPLANANCKLVADQTLKSPSGPLPAQDPQSS